MTSFCFFITNIDNTTSVSIVDFEQVIAGRNIFLVQ